MPDKQGIDRVRIVKTVTLSLLVLGTLAIGIMYLVKQDIHYWAVRSTAYFLIALCIAVGLAYFTSSLVRRIRRLPLHLPHVSLAVDFLIWGLLAVGVYAVLVYSIRSGNWSAFEWPRTLFIRFPFVGMPIGFPIAVYIAVACFFIHALYLRLICRADTHTTRMKTLRIVLFLIIILSVSAAWFAIDISNPYTDYPGQNKLKTAICTTSIGLIFLFWIPGLVIYSVPSSWLSLLPLAFHYFIGAFYLFNNSGNPLAVFFLTFAYAPLAGYLFPKYRRIREYWKPSRLPRIAVRRAGYTLIELLIMIALLAILTAGLATLSSTVSRTHSRQNRWERGLQMAQDELALLRGQPQLPVLGVHPIEPQLQKNYEFAGASQVEIKLGPSDGLREVRITVRMRGEGLDKDIELAALLPAGRNSR